MRLGMTAADYDAIVDYYREQYPALAVDHSLDNWHSPAVNFENASRIKGISHTYTMPEGKSPVEILRVIDSQAARYNVAVNLAQGMEQTAEGVPDGLNRVIENELVKLHPVVLQTFDQLAAANAELASLPADRSNTVQLMQIISGALSEYSPADIRFYAIEGNTRERGEAARTQWRKRDRKITELAGHTMKWTPAPSTQMLILEKLRDRRESNERAGDEILR